MQAMQCRPERHRFANGLRARIRRILKDPDAQFVNFFSSEVFEKHGAFQKTTQTQAP